MADRRQCKVQKLQNQVHGPASHALPAKEIVIQESDLVELLLATRALLLSYKIDGCQHT